MNIEQIAITVDAEMYEEGRFSAATAYPEEFLRRCLSKLAEHVTDERVMKVMDAGADTIESLRQQLKEALAVRENCTLVPTAELKKMQEQLAASQLQIQQLRDALGICLKEIESWCDEVGYERFNHPEVNNAIALPTDTTALEALIAKAGEMMRERAVKSCLSLFDLDDESCNEAEQCSEEIRALPGITLKDIT